MLVHRESRIYRSDHTAADLTVRAYVRVCVRVCDGALYGSPFWQGCLKAFAVTVTAVSYLRAVKTFGFFIIFLGRLSTSLIQFIVSVGILSVLFRPASFVRGPVIYSEESVRFFCANQRSSFR